MRVRIILFVASLVVFAGTTSRTSAQTSDSSTVPASDRTVKLRDAIRTLQPQAEIRASSRGVLTEGRLLMLSHDSVWIGQGRTEPAALSVSAIDRLWSREGSGARGALIGGLLGAAFLGALGSNVDDLTDAFCDPSYCEKSGGSSTVLGVVAGGLGGAIIGLMVGKGMKRWKSHYP